MKKRAILFAMNEYRTSNSILAGKLPATVNDVKTLNKKLKQLNFDTEEYVDLTLKDFKSKLKSFA
ncbi:TPA: caspase family protein, partial [Clostridium perfringens]|nr:caspase family protein [Clostridium perfringens]